MATHLVSWSTNQVGCLAITQNAALSDADVAAIDQSIADDQAALLSAPMLGPGGVALQPGTVVNAFSTSQVATLTTVSIASGPALTSVQVGYDVYGIGIQPGTVVAAVGTTTIDLSLPPTISQAGGTFLITPPGGMNGFYQKTGWLTVPNRGQLQVFPGDVLVVTPMGNVFLLPADEFMTGTNSPFRYV